jgi:hypothetical protein
MAFCDSPMSSEFNKQGSIPEPGPGVCDGDPCGPFGEYRRTPSPNAVKEKIFDGSVPKPSGEDDMF